MTSMRFRFVFSVCATIGLAALCGSVPGQAGGLSWPSETAKAKAPAPLADPPAMLERAPSNMLGNAPAVRWPSDTAKAKPMAPPADPPAVLERPASVVDKTLGADPNVPGQTPSAACRDGRECVVCVAACDGKAPQVVHQQKRIAVGPYLALSTGDNDSDGVAPGAPRFAREPWAGIICGTESGCRVSGVYAPYRGYYSYWGAYGVRSRSVYFD